MHLSADEVGRYKSDGFLLKPALFLPEEVERIHREARHVFALQMARLGIVTSAAATAAELEAGMVTLFEQELEVFTRCGKQAQHLISLHTLSLDGRILATLRRLGLAFPIISTRPVLFFNSPRLAKKEAYWRLSAHQDWRSMQGSLDSMVVWLPLVDVDRKLGALEVLPGSHRWGLLPADMVDGFGHLRQAVSNDQFVAIEVEKGDALFFSTFLVHRSGTNVTDSLRWSCHFRYNNLAERTFLERGFPHPYIYRPQEELITEGFPDRQALVDLFDHLPSPQP